MKGVEQLTQKINSEFESGRIVLPSLPEIALKVRKAVNDEDKSIRDLATLIQTDPSITARVIQISNSPLYKTATDVNDCYSAISKLGMKTTRDIVTCLVLHNMFSTSEKRVRIRLEKIWKESSYVAAISSVLARKIPELQVDTALLAGLIHNIGKLPILNYIVEFPELLEDDSQIDVILDSMHQSIGTKILEKWGFDEQIKDVPEHVNDFMRESNGATDYIDVVIVAKIHSLFGTARAVNLPVLADIPAFKKLTLSDEGVEASMKVLQEAKQDIQLVMQSLL
ncbi:MAG: HDOD domain-containing protein [Gammaproteobacteria bacterium]